MAIVVNKANRVPYEYLGENKFKNIHTGKEGEVPEDKANGVFVINADLALLCEKNKNLKTLIQSLSLIVG